jgi:hypothetical protein
MLKKTLVLGVIVTVLLLVMAVPAMAAPGGAPAAHGVDGKTFGGLVSGLATSYPGAVADHVSKAPAAPDAAAASMAGGVPALHGAYGKDFGMAVSGLATSYPGAVAEHVAGR